METNLSDVLSYKNEDVVDRFLTMYDLEHEEAQKIFTETLKWLWLGNKIDGVFIDDSTLIIDEMWHNFILFTQEYEFFCLNNFGRYLHHQPEKRNARSAGVVPGGAGRYRLERPGSRYRRHHGFPPEGKRP